jgi:hypothetical protein
MESVHRFLQYEALEMLFVAPIQLENSCYILQQGVFREIWDIQKPFARSKIIFVTVESKIK